MVRSNFARTLLLLLNTNTNTNSAAPYRDGERVRGVAVRVPLDVGALVVAGVDGDAVAVDAVADEAVLALAARAGGLVVAVVGRRAVLARVVAQTFELVEVRVGVLAAVHAWIDNNNNNEL